MLRPEQLSAALGRLDPHDREIFYLSLHKRVPDEALARLYDSTPGEVARLRAEAIERLADDVGVRRGDDFGAVLTALLEPSTWAEIDGGSVPAPAAKPPTPEPAEKPAQAEPGPKPKRGHRRGLRIAEAAVVAGCLLVLAGFVGATALVDDDGDGSGEGTATRSFVPERTGALAAPFPSEPVKASCYPTALVRQRVALFDRPGGKRKVRIAARTDWNTPRILGVVRQRGRWLAVLVPELQNGEVGWLPARKARLDCVTWSVHADLSKRRLVVRRGGKAVRKMGVGVGRRRNPTPTGRFAVTDKLRVSQSGSPYGCCVLALTGHQTRLPPNWPGGDRLAVHATANRSDVGRRVSLGCLRVVGAQARWLIKNVPVGAPVFIRN